VLAVENLDNIRPFLERIPKLYYKIYLNNLVWYFELGTPPPTFLIQLA